MKRPKRGANSAVTAEHRCPYCRHVLADPAVVRTDTGKRLAMVGAIRPSASHRRVTIIQAANGTSLFSVQG